MCCAAPDYAMLYMLCCVESECAMLCHAVLCYARVYHAVHAVLASSKAL